MLRPDGADDGGADDGGEHQLATTATTTASVSSRRRRRRRPARTALPTQTRGSPAHAAPPRPHAHAAPPRDGNVHRDVLLAEDVGHTFTAPRGRGVESRGLQPRARPPQRRGRRRQRRAPQLHARRRRAHLATSHLNALAGVGLGMVIGKIDRGGRARSRARAAPRDEPRWPAPRDRPVGELVLRLPEVRVDGLGGGGGSALQGI